MVEFTLKYCKRHGLTKFGYRAKYGRCMKCSSMHVSNRRRKIKLKAIEYKGGKCYDCGLQSEFPAVYDFHHHEGEKDFNISKDGNTRSWEKVKVELEKCVLLCANCHRIRHAKMEHRVGFEPTKDVIPSN
jgi:predicted HNH restriction endonuclease